MSVTPLLQQLLVLCNIKFRQTSCRGGHGSTHLPSLWNARWHCRCFKTSNWSWDM